MALTLRDFETFPASNTPVVGANVYLYNASSTHPNPGSTIGSTTTNGNGMWEFTGLTGGPYDVEVVYNGRHHWRKGNSAFPSAISGANFAAVAIDRLLVGPRSGADAQPDFRTLAKLYDSNNNKAFEIIDVASMVNYLTLTGGASGVSPILAAAGSGTNLDHTVAGKGTGSPVLYTPSGTQVARVNLAGTLKDIVTSGVTSSGHGPAWQTWTPVVAQGASSPTFTTNYARYCVLGKIAFFQLSLAFTGAGSAGNTIDVSGWPSGVAPLTVGSRHMCGVGWYLDSGTDEYPGGVHLAAGPVVRLLSFKWGAFGLGQNPNFAVANTDELSMDFHWEIA